MYLACKVESSDHTKNSKDKSTEGGVNRSKQGMISRRQGNIP